MNFRNMSIEEILQYPIGKSFFNFKKTFKALTKKDEDGLYIYLAGKFWPQFDYEKGLDLLIKKDTFGFFIYYAGVEWKQFDYKKGFNGLVKNNESGIFVYNACNNWVDFESSKTNKENIRLFYSVFKNLKEIRKMA